jgi:hypothetical protein
MEGSVMNLNNIRYGSLDILTLSISNSIAKEWKKKFSFQVHTVSVKVVNGLESEFEVVVYAINDTVKTNVK